MKSHFKILLLFVFAICMHSCSNNTDSEKEKLVSPNSNEGDIIPDQYIIEIQPTIISSARSRFDATKQYSREEKGKIMEDLNAQVDAELSLWLKKNGIAKEKIVQRYVTTFVGFAAVLDETRYKNLQALGEIKMIEHDRMEYIPEYKIESVDRQGEGSRAQTTPCGITNVGGSAPADAGRWVWIVDSGIDLDHPDLTVVTNTTYAKSFVGGTADDCNGHGTHVAGITGARNNTIGVIGVAAGANVVPVRVFACSGGSPTSTIIAGINHVATYDLAGDVVNMSLGGYYGTSGCSTGSSYLTSVNSLASGGSRVAIASGNNNSNAANYQPGCINGTNIFTVTNMRCNKTYYNDPTYGGNFGSPPVDWIATGTSVFSTYLNGGYATLTGTSMATPHVAGIMQVRNAAPLQNGTVAYGGVNYKIAVR